MTRSGPKWRLAALLAGSACGVVLLAACGDSDDGGGDDAAASDGTAASTDDGPTAAAAAEVWTGELEGAPTIVEVGIAPADAPELAAVEAFRETAGIDPVEYIRVTIDNSDSDIPNASATIDINGGDGTDETLAITTLCTDLGFFWEVPFDDSLPSEEATAQFDAAVADRDAALAGIGCDPAEAEIAAGAVGVYWLSRPLTDPAIESLMMRFQEFERS